MLLTTLMGALPRFVFERCLLQAFHKCFEAEARRTCHHFFFCTFWADLVDFSLPSFLVTLLMTPTATVCLMSRTAKRPSGGYSAKDSTHIGLDGVRVTMAASPDLTAGGFSSSVLPERRSHFALSSVNLQAMWDVWQSRTGVYPAVISPGWFRTMTWSNKGKEQKVDT